MRASNFYLGSHHPGWLAILGVPLCVSRTRLKGRRSFPRALAPWMLDSGAFSEIATHGKWTVAPAQYALEVERFAREVGSLAAVSQQDWMCEPRMLKKTGLTIARHQSNTVRNYLELRDLGVDRLFPVLQGWTSDDYHRHVELYDDHGVQLDQLPVVGIGSVCRRQAEDEISQVLHSVSSLGIKLHGFGVKMQGLAKGGCALHSADSMAWSFSARREAPLPGCKSHINCANCEIYAMGWRERILQCLAPKSSCGVCRCPSAGSTRS